MAGACGHRSAVTLPAGEHRSTIATDDHGEKFTDQSTDHTRFRTSLKVKFTPEKTGYGRVAQLDRALPSGAVEKSTISCKNQGILISVGSQESEQKRAETHDNWNCASYESLDWARRAWGALRVI
jgi:hypothetical protein